MRIIVCGGREYHDWKSVTRALDYLHRNVKIEEVIEGAASGADDLAYRWAKSRKVRSTRVPADWAKYRRSAGAIRNKQMLELAPDAVVAFPGGSGTAHMVSIAEAAGIKVYDYRRGV